MNDGEKTLVELRPVVPADAALIFESWGRRPENFTHLEKSGFTREAILKNWVTYAARGGGAFDNYSYVRVPGDAKQAT